MSRKKSSSSKRNRKKRSKRTVPLTLEHHICPITKERFTDPVICEDGFTYDREAITAWLQTNNTSPMTREHIGKQIIPNKQLCQQLGIDLSSEMIVKEHSVPLGQTSLIPTSSLQHSSMINITGNLGFPQHMNRPYQAGTRLLGETSTGDTHITITSANSLNITGAYTFSNFNNNVVTFTTSNLY